MKLMFKIAAGVLILGLIGCASSGSGVKSDSTDRQYERNTTVQVDNPTISLADYLRRIPGVRVMGSGGNARVIVQGVSSFISSTDPLFVIDGVRVGRSFSQVHSMLSMHTVETIKVLKGTDAATYGIDGSNGVIVITTKKTSG